MSTGSCSHSSWANCSSCLRLEGCLCQTALFSSFHRCSTGFKAGFMEGHFRIVQCSCVLLTVCILGHCPVGGLHDLKQSFLRLGSLLQSAFLVLRFDCALHRFKALVPQTSSPKTQLGLLHVSQSLWCFVLWTLCFFVCRHSMTHLSKISQKHCGLSMYSSKFSVSVFWGVLLCLFQWAVRNTNNFVHVVIYLVYT